MNKLSVFLLGLLFLIKTDIIISQSFANVETVLQKGHSRHITCMAYSPDGKYIVTGSIDNTLILWNAENSKQIRNFAMHTDFIRSVYFSNDGKNILTSSGDNRALITEIATGKVVTEIKIETDRLFRACYSPDNSKVLTMNDRDEIAVWDAVTGDKLGTFGKDYSAGITSQWFTPDGSKVMTYKSYEEANLVDINTGKPVFSFSFDKPLSFAISSTGKYVVIGSAKLFATVFSLETGKKLFDLIDDAEKQCDGCNTLVAFSPNGEYIATAIRYTGVSVWDAKNGKRIVNFPIEDDRVDEISFSCNNKYVIGAYNDESFILDIKTGKEVFRYTDDGVECTPVFSPDNKYLLTTNERNTAALWVFNADRLQKDRKIRTYEGYLNKKSDYGLKYEQNSWFHSSIIKFMAIKPAVAVHPNGKLLAKGKIDSIAIIIDLETGKVIKTLKGHSKVILATDFSSDGKQLLTAGGDGIIKIWDTETGQELQTINAHNDVIFDAKFSSDDKYIVSGSWDATFRIWNSVTGKLLQVGSLDNMSPIYVEFTPNDLYVLTGDLGGKLKLWEADAGKEFREIIGHTGIVNSACFSPDGKIMVTASLDGKVKMWDLLSGMLINKFYGHTSSVYAVAYDTKSRFVASGGNDRVIRIWDAFTGKELKVLTGHSGAITSLNITSDGKRIISSTTDGEIKVWNADDFTEIYTYIQIDRNNWLTKTPLGYFDGSSDALKLINYVSGLDVITVSSLFEKYYAPNLLKRINEGEVFEKSVSDINTLIKNSPTVSFELMPDNSIEEFASIDSIAWFKNSLSLSVEVTDQGAGIDELRIYSNGKLINSETFDNTQKRAGRKLKQVYDIPITAGLNTISAIALDKDRIESMPVNLKVYYDGIESDMDLYIVSVGINNYQNPSYHLSYAIDDAKAYTKQVKTGAVSIFKTVEDYFIKDTEANKEAIHNVFSQIAQKAGSEDVFIFYFAGHGAMSMSGGEESSDFYIIPYDVTNIYGNDDALKQKAISASEILEMSKKIAARKQLFILDACQSGSALNAFNTRGAGREKAIAQLARSTGTFFLLASGAIQYASEAKELGHGIFTYAILEALEGKADGGERDEKITAGELKSYVEDRVPELTKQYLLTPQYPTGYGFGQDFPIVLVK
jgi:WD40 repeat protein